MCSGLKFATPIHVDTANMGGAVNSNCTGRWSLMHDHRMG